MNQPTQSHCFGTGPIDPLPVTRSSVRVGPRSKEHRETKIKLNKNGDTIESIHITCACGEEIVVQCQYSDDAK